MQNPFMPITNIYQTQLEASRQFTDAVFSSTEKIDQVLLNATHRALTEQLKFAQSLVSARNPEGMADAQATFMSQRPERAIDYQRDMLQIFSEMQNEIGKSMRQYMDQLGRTTIDNIDATQNGQGQPDQGALNPVTGMFSVWESAFREAASLANKNITAARTTFENGVNASYASATKAAEEVDQEISSTSERKAAAGGRRK